MTPRRPTQEPPITEVDWLTSTDIPALHGQVATILGDRKTQLYVAACGRLTPFTPPNDLLRRVSDVVERCADGQEDPETIRVLNQEAGKACSFAYHKIGNDSGPHFLALAALRMTDYPPNRICVPHVSLFLSGALEKLVNHRAADEARQLHADLLRDIAGNPFRLSIRRRGRRSRGEGPRAKIERRWRTPGVAGLVETIYTERDFALMPVLADALQDAGCEVTDLLDHCRDAPVHARGCWVIDLLRESS